MVIGSLIAHLATKSRLNTLHHIEMSEKGNQMTELEKQVAALQTKIQAQTESLKTVQDAMLDSFKSAASAALGQNNEQFLTLAKTQFEAQSKEADGTLEQKGKAINDLLKPVKEAIDGYKKKVDDLETNSNTTFGQVKEMLTTIQSTNAVLQKETGALVSALKNPQIRGRWGEIGLRNLVEHAGMLEYCDFAEQVYNEGEEATIKPDMVINLPDNKHVVVDSKVPLKAYMEAIEAADEKTCNQLLEDHAKAVRGRINELSKKQYAAQFTNSPDLVVLFMPIESALNAALTTDRDLLQHAMSKKIILATPTTLLVVLRSFALVWQQHNMTENALEIMETARELHARLVKFTEHLGSVGTGLKSALKNYNEAVGSFENRVLVTGRKLESLDAKSQKENLKEIGTVDNTIRAINKSEE